MTEFLEMATGFRQLLRSSMASESFAQGSAEPTLFDDPDNLSETYQPGERRHGTSIASLVLYGDLAGEEGRKTPLQNKIYFMPVMQVDPNTRDLPSTMF